jgi:HAD superfamily hydrolase (TIGR01662 family)
MSRITTVFFDLGSTLVYSKDPWPAFYELADRALAGALASAGVGIDLDSFYSEFGGFIRAYYENRMADNIERTTFTALRDILNRKGFRNVADPILRLALDAMYAVTQQNWYAEDDAVPTLQALQGQGYRLGLISNTSDDKNVQGIVDRWGFRPYFEYIVTSAGCGIRKPDERIFNLALNHFQASPEAAAMVGDTPDADILGANRLGIYSIWVTRRATCTDPEPAHPDAVVETLNGIPLILASA